MALEAEESGFGSWLLLPISCMKTESQFDNLKKMSIIIATSA